MKKPLSPTSSMNKEDVKVTVIRPNGDYAASSMGSNKNLKNMTKFSHYAPRQELRQFAKARNILQQTQGLKSIKKNILYGNASHLNIKELPYESYNVARPQTYGSEVRIKTSNQRSHHSYMNDGIEMSEQELAITGSIDGRHHKSNTHLTNSLKKSGRNPYAHRLQLLHNQHSVPRSKTQLRRLPPHVRMHQSSRQGLLARQYLDLLRGQVYRPGTRQNTASGRSR